MNNVLEMANLCEKLNDYSPFYLGFRLQAHNYNPSIFIMNEDIQIGKLQVHKWNRKWDWKFYVESTGYSSFKTMNGWTFETKGLESKILQLSEEVYEEFWRIFSREHQNKIWKVLTRQKLDSLVGSSCQNDTYQRRAEYTLPISNVTIYLRLISKLDEGHYSLNIDGECKNAIKIPEELPKAKRLIKKVKRFEKDLINLLEG